MACARLMLVYTVSAPFSIAVLLRSSMDHYEREGERSHKDTQRHRRTQYLERLLLTSSAFFLFFSFSLYYFPPICCDDAGCCWRSVKCDSNSLSFECFIIIYRELFSFLKIIFFLFLVRRLVSALLIGTSSFESEAEIHSQFNLRHQKAIIKNNK